MPIAGVVIPKEVVFRAGLPGFPGERRFSVREASDLPLARLAPLDGDWPSFIVLTSPSAYFPDLEPFDLDASCEASLGMPGAGDLSAWLILTVRQGVVTANLLGPVVVNTTNGLAVQVVRGDLSLPVAAPLVGLVADDVGTGALACSS